MSRLNRLKNQGSWASNSETKIFECGNIWWFWLFALLHWKFRQFFKSSFYIRRIKIFILILHCIKLLIHRIQMCFVKGTYWSIFIKLLSGYPPSFLNVDVFLSDRKNLNNITVDELCEAIVISSTLIHLYAIFIVMFFMIVYNSLIQ